MNPKRVLFQGEVLIVFNDLGIDSNLCLQFVKKCDRLISQSKFCLIRLVASNKGKKSEVSWLHVLYG